MRLKSFHAPSMVEAMRLVRDALGDDAIIVATREEEGGVRLTAAIDDVEEPLLPPPSSHAQEPTARRPWPHGYRREPEIDVVDLVCDALARHGTPPLITDRLLNTISPMTPATRWKRCQRRSTASSPFSLSRSAGRPGPSC